MLVTISALLFHLNMLKTDLERKSVFQTRFKASFFFQTQGTRNGCVAVKESGVDSKLRGRADNTTSNVPL